MGTMEAATRHDAKGASAPKFWRSDALPFIEARSIDDGREVCYAKHSHETFSIGAVTGGRSEYLNRHAREWIGAGAVVTLVAAAVMFGFEIHRHSEYPPRSGSAFCRSAFCRSWGLKSLRLDVCNHLL